MYQEKELYALCAYHITKKLITPIMNRLHRFKMQ
jgi:hypothetical protein